MSDTFIIDWKADPEEVIDEVNEVLHNALHKLGYVVRFEQECFHGDDNYSFTLKIQEPL